MKVSVDTSDLRTICGMPFNNFAGFGARTPTPNGDYFFRDNGQAILGVAHLDSVLPDFWREEPGLVFTPVLDDRLGAYLLIHLLPLLGVGFDLLLTDGEEKGQSTAQYFEPPRQYNWLFSFDLAGMGAVMYHYGTPGHARLLEQHGIIMRTGTFSDIAFLGHLGCKAFNFGCGYHNQHSRSCHAVLSETEEMVRRFVGFYGAHSNTLMPHLPTKPLWKLREEMLNRCHLDT